MAKLISRRDFLKGTAAGALGFAAAGVLGTGTLTMAAAEEAEQGAGQGAGQDKGPARRQGCAARSVSAAKAGDPSRASNIWKPDQCAVSQPVEPGETIKREGALGTVPGVR